MDTLCFDDNDFGDEPYSLVELDPVACDWFLGSGKLGFVQKCCCPSGSERCLWIIIYKERRRTMKCAYRTENEQESRFIG
jgi:hypothetical protein